MSGRARVANQLNPPPRLRALRTFAWPNSSSCSFVSGTPSNDPMGLHFLHARFLQEAPRVDGLVGGGTRRLGDDVNTQVGCSVIFRSASTTAVTASIVVSCPVIAMTST